MSTEETKDVTMEETTQEVRSMSTPHAIAFK